MSRYLAYLSLTFKLAVSRLRNRLGLTLLSLVGISLSVGLVVSIPVFSELVSRLVLRQELTDFASVTQRPLFTLRYYSLPSTGWPMKVNEVDTNGLWLADITRREVGLPIVSSYIQVESPGLLFRPGQGGGEEEGRPSGSGTGGTVTFFSVAFIEGAEKHMEVVTGQPFATAEDSPYLEVWVQAPLAAKLGLNVGDVHRLAYFAAGAQDPIPIHIAGVWEPAEGSEGFWYGDPTKTLQDHFLTTREAYVRWVEPRVYEGTGFNFWYYVLDDNKMLLDKVEDYARGLEMVRRLSGEKLPRPGLDLSPIEPLRRAAQRKDMLSTMLYGMSLPVLGLLFFFLGLISSIAVRYQKGEAALLSSRGATGFHILGISLAEALLLAVVGIPLSLLTGYGLSRLAGQAYDFLSFGHRDLPQTGLMGMDTRYFVAALGLSVLTRLVPAVGAARQSVVAYERERSRPRISPPWLRMTLVVPLVLATAYAYQQLQVRGTLGMLSWEPSGSPLQDPLIFLAPTLFFFAAALLVASVFPMLMRLLDFIAARALAVPGYLGFRNLGREGGQYANALFLVVLCLAVGAFQASMAQSANRWFVERLQYKVGADFSFKLVEEESIGARLLPVTDYLQIRGVEDAARVGDYPAEFRPPNASRSQKIRLIGLDRVDFQRVAYWRGDYAPESLGEMMNRLALVPDGIIVPRQALAQTGLQAGDKIRLDVSVDYERRGMEFTIAGVYDYFPSVYLETQPAVIANLEYIFEQAGMTLTHGVWLRTAPGMDAKRLYEACGGLGVTITQIQDLRGMISDDTSRLERVGVFGMLSIGFLASAGLSILGLLMYISASLSSRLQRFAVLRAIGFSLNQLMTVVTLEFVTVIFYGVGGGSLLGVLASELFVPYFQLTEDPSLPVPPFVAEIAWREIGSFSLIFAAFLGTAVAALLYGVARRQLAQALRLGDQE
ncbi:MAG: FtsX-like permease family protein [Anaerolineae bacterium]